MKLTRLALAAIALSLGTPALLMAQNWPPPNHDRGGWDAPHRSSGIFSARDSMMASKLPGTTLTVTIHQTWSGGGSSGIPRFRHPTATHTAKASAAATTRPSLTSAKVPIATDSPRSFYGFPDHAFQSWEAVFTGAESDLYARNKS